MGLRSCLVRILLVFGLALLCLAVARLCPCQWALSFPCIR